MSILLIVGWAGGVELSPCPTWGEQIRHHSECE
jgi:hypothetical protein